MKLPQAAEAPRGRNDLKVIPFNFVDNMKGWRMGIAANTFRFNAAMDAQKLRDSLQRLFEMEGWRKLGARLRMNVSLTRNYCPICPLTNQIETRPLGASLATQIRREMAGVRLVPRTTR